MHNVYTKTKNQTGGNKMSAYRITRRVVARRTWQCAICDNNMGLYYCLWDCVDGHPAIKVCTMCHNKLAKQAITTPEGHLVVSSNAIADLINDYS